jgi:hypothetical protein
MQVSSTSSTLDAIYRTALNKIPVVQLFDLKTHIKKTNMHICILSAHLSQACPDFPFGLVARLWQQVVQGPQLLKNYLLF